MAKAVSKKQEDEGGEQHPAVLKAITGGRDLKKEHLRL